MNKEVFLSFFAICASTFSGSLFADGGVTFVLIVALSFFLLLETVKKKEASCHKKKIIKWRRSILVASLLLAIVSLDISLGTLFAEFGFFLNLVLVLFEKKETTTFYKRLIFYVSSVLFFVSWTIQQHSRNEQQMRMNKLLKQTSFVSGSIDESKRYGLYIGEYTVKEVEPINEKTVVKINSIWIEKCSKKAYKFVWFFSPLILNGYRVVIKAENENIRRGEKVNFILCETLKTSFFREYYDVFYLDINSSEFPEKMTVEYNEEISGHGKRVFQLQMKK
jgi:hypothetical protein